MIAHWSFWCYFFDWQENCKSFFNQHGGPMKDYGGEKKVISETSLRTAASRMFQSGKLGDVSEEELFKQLKANHEKAGYEVQISLDFTKNGVI